MTTLLALAAALALSQAPADAAPAPGAADAGVVATPPSLDVSKLPFSRDTVKLVMDHHTPRIQGCYEETMAEKDRVVAGRLLTSFIVTPQGTVRAPKVLKKGSTLRVAAMDQCVVAVLATLEFPRPADGREHPIEYPFNLKPIK